MHRALRVAAQVALALVLALVASHWLGLSLPGSQRVPQRPVTPSSIFPSPTPVDLYDVMGTLTFESGRTIPSARLHPAEAVLVTMLDKGGIVINEIRPAESWPSDRISLPKIVRGVAVVHALLVPATTLIVDVVPLEGALNASVCATGDGRQMVSYHLALAGRTATFDYAEALYFASYGAALLITPNADAWKRLLQVGGVSVQAGPCSTPSARVS